MKGRGGGVWGVGSECRLLAPVASPNVVSLLDH